jgi:membrane associated rhomboid family serine protease
MFPIRDHNPSGRVPYVTYALILINVGVFLAYWLTITDENQLGLFFYTWGLVPDRTMAGASLPTLISHMFLHGGWMHLAGNMLFLWIFGDNLEDEMGHAGFAVFYIVSGFAAAGLQVAADPASAVPMVGASGAIAGVLGGYLLLFPRARVDVLFIFVIFFRIFAIPAWIVLGVWFGLQLVNGAVNPGDGVAYLAHVGGFIGGAVLTLPALLRRGGRAFWARTQGHPQHPAAEYKLSKSSIPMVRKR